VWRCIVLASVAATACHDDSWLQYEWDDRQVLCSFSVDDIDRDAPWERVAGQMEYAAEHQTVAVMHAHVPGQTLSIAGLTRILDTAVSNSLDFVTFSELDPATPSRGALALCFDDSAVDTWYEQRELLASYGARVTFFITRFHNWTDEGRAKLAELAAAGHDVQAHAVNHLNARDYVSEHGLAAYLDDDALPSITILEDAGYPITSYAFPFGASSDELDTALLEHVARVRVSPGSCPY
jgi:hypothetical protein